jgi:hypothetical protein
MTTTAMFQWCGHPFTPRNTGGKTQQFCRSHCRRALDGAGRRFATRALVGRGEAVDGALQTEVLPS